MRIRARRVAEERPWIISARKTVHYEEQIYWTNRKGLTRDSGPEEDVGCELLRHSAPGCKRPEVEKGCRSEGSIDRSSNLSHDSEEPSLDEQAVNVVFPDPEPDILLSVFECQSAVLDGDAGRPDFLARASSDFLELERAVVRVVFEQGELFIGSAADVGRQRPVALLETGVSFSIAVLTISTFVTAYTCEIRSTARRAWPVANGRSLSEQS